MALDPSQLREPVVRDDMLDEEEMIENATEVAKALFDRVRFQYQGDTWISNELWQVYCQLQAAHERFSQLRATNAFPE